MQHETLAAWLQWLEQQHPKAIDLGLERVAQVAARLSLLPQLQKNENPPPTIITVAGTNGKGSFVASLQSLLMAQGKTVACYTSPHILRFNERMQINAEMVNDEKLMAVFETVYYALQGISLSYFEFTTLAALVLFQDANIEYCILEVGLGGRLDAVNIITPDWAVITSIGIDHCDYLGDSLDDIAYEKCGILRKETPLICAESSRLEILEQNCKNRKSWVIGQDFHVQQTKPGLWQYRAEGTLMNSEVLPETGLSLPSQAAAITLAQLLLDKNKPMQASDFSCLAELSLAGRFQCFDDDGLQVVLDVAHNPQAIDLLKQRLQDQLPLAEGAKRIAVFAMLADKDANTVISCLKDEINAWFVGDLSHERGMPAEAMAALLYEQDIKMVSVNKNIRQAYARARSLCNAGDQIVVLGSFFTVAALLPKLQKSHNAKKLKEA